MVFFGVLGALGGETVLADDRRPTTAFRPV
jgi:hypothetical protein